MQANRRIFSRLLRVGKYLFVPQKKPGDFMHMPTAWLEAGWNLALNKAANEKIESGFFQENLAVIIAIPKSSSKNLVRVTRILQDALGPKDDTILGRYRPELSQGRYMGLNQTSDLQIEITIDVLDGGVVHTHSTPNMRSLHVLERLGSKYIILFRHPLFQLVSRYCQCLQAFDRIHFTGDAPKFLQDPIFPVASSVFNGNENVDEVIRYLIEGGPLEAVLIWMSLWLNIRDQKKSLVIRYEDISDGTNHTLIEISRFLYDSTPDIKVMTACQNIYGKYKKSIKDNGPTFTYPRGWPGSSESALAYVNAENRSLYKDVVSRFVESSPIGAPLLEVYPDIIDPICPVH